MMTDTAAEIRKPYRLLVTASRTWEDAGLINEVLAGVLGEHPDAVLVSGHCPDGGDAIAERCWAALCGYPTVRDAIDAGRVEVYPIEGWRQYKRGAGPERNRSMVRSSPDECVAFQMPCAKKGCRTLGAHDSHGTAGCYSFAVKAGVPSRLFRQGSQP